MNALIAAAICVGSIFLVLLFIILFAKFKISVIINNKIIKVFLGRIKVYDSSKKKSKTNGNTDKKIDKDKEFEKKYKGLKQSVNFIRKILDDKNDDIIYILKYIKKTFYVKKLDISLDYGFGDAAVTGITGGIIWGLISNICGFAGRYIDVNSFTNIAVKPHYTEKILDYNITFVFYIRTLNLIKTYRRVKRFKKTLEGRD